MISAILDLAVRRRWAVLLVTLAAAATGIWAGLRLPIDAVPDVTNVQVQVNGIAPALTPIEIEKQVTLPVEAALAGIPKLEATRSFSRNGFSQVTAVFADGTDIYFARQRVAERLNDAKTSLPPGVELGMGPTSTGLGEIYWWAIEYAPAERSKATAGQPGWQSDGSYLTPEGDKLTDAFERLVYLRTLQDWVVRPQMKTVHGVAGADAIGGYVKQYLVQPDPTRLQAYGLSFQKVAEALEINNANRGANYIERNGEGYVVRAAGRLESPEEIGSVVVATRAGIPVRISDVAEVTLGRELRTGSASINGSEAVLGTALMLVGGNSRTVAAAANAKLAEINKRLPPDVVARPLLNRTDLVDATIETVARNLGEGALLVIAVLFLLLGNIRAALITASVIPLTMLLTATGMVQAHVSANLMSLGALDFGLIVDGAIIIIENCLRHLGERQREAGRTLTLEERLRTVAVSAKEMIEPTVFGQAIIILVYVPLLTFTGVEGKTFEPMALTVIIALVAAFVLSITFVPAAAAIFFTGKVKERESAAILYARRHYGRWLEKALRIPGTILAAAIVLVTLSALLFKTLGEEFSPTLDEKNIVMEVKRIPSTSLSQSQIMQLANERAVSRLPEVAFVFSRTGTPDLAADPMPPSASDTYIILKPREEWPDSGLSKVDLITRIEAEADKLPGNQLGFSQPIQMRFNELVAGVREDIAIKVFGDEFGPMLGAANRIAKVLAGIEGANNVKVEPIGGLPFLEVRLDKPAIARHGLNLANVQEVIGTAVGGRNAGLIFEGDRRFAVVLRLSDEDRGNLETLGSLPVSLPQGGVLPLRDLASFEFTEGPNQVSRENGKRRVVVTAEVRGRDIGSVAAEAQTRIAQEVTLPFGTWLQWGGQFETFATARTRLAVVVPVCFALVFLLLLAALGTAREALLAFSAVPLALTGGIVALWLRDMPFSISAAVGFIALSGVAVLNGLVMLSTIRQLVREGKDKDEAIRTGAMTRLRPVLMTAIVASFGFVPMMVATGTGAEVQKPLATVVVGGLISATFLTLFVLPALYRLFGTARVAVTKVVS